MRPETQITQPTLWHDSRIQDERGCSCGQGARSADDVNRQLSNKCSSAAARVQYAAGRYRVERLTSGTGRREVAVDVGNQLGVVSYEGLDAAAAARRHDSCVGSYGTRQ